MSVRALRAALERMRSFAGRQKEHCLARLRNGVPLQGNAPLALHPQTSPHHPHTHTKTALAKAGRIKNDSGKMVFVEMREIFVKSDTVFVRCNAIYHHNLAIGSTTPVKNDQSGVALVKPFTMPKSIASRLLGLHVTAARN